MQSKTALLATLVILCAGILGFTLLNFSGPEPLSQWPSGEEVSRAVEITPAELDGGATESLESRQELGRSSVSADLGERTRSPRVVRGRVVDKSGAPVEGAGVFLTAGERSRRGRGRRRVEKEAVTSSDGTFSFTGLSFADMWVSLELRHTDFAVTTLTKSFSETDDRDVGDVPVLAGGTIEGRVIDARGMPISNATLALAAEGFDWRRMMGRRRSDPEVTTDAGGAFRMEKITPGSYRIRARAPRHQRNTTGAITVVDTQQLRLDPIELGPGFVLSGVVSRSDGKPLENAMVEIRGQTRERGKRTNAKGEFRFDHLAAGKFDVEVSADGYLRNVDYRAVAVPGAENLVIAMQPGLRIEGVVTDALSGLPVPRFAARVRRLGDLPDPVADQERARREMSMREMGQLWRLGDKRTEAQQKKLDELIAAMRDARGRGRNRGGGRGRSRSNGNLPGDPGEVQARPDGRFRFEGLREGVYVVDIGSPDHQKIRTAKVELRQGGFVAPLAVAVRRGFTVAGTVSTGGDSPVRNATVELRLVLDDSSPEVDAVSSATWVSSGPRTTGVLETQSKADGSFSIAHASAGRYLLRVSAEDYATYSTEPFDLKNDQGGFDLRMGGLGVIEGRVRGLSADRVGTAKVLVHMGPRTWRDVSVKEDGSYRISGLEPGDYLVRTYAGEGARGAVIREIYGAARDPNGAVIDVKVKEGGVHRFDLTMPEEVVGEVVGRVFVNGGPAAGYRVSLRKVDGEGESERGGFFGRQRGLRATVDAKGDFRISQVKPGEYWASVTSGRRRRGGGDVAKARIYVNARETATVPLIAVDLGSLSGVVVDPSESQKGREKNPITGRVSAYLGVTELPDSSTPSGAEVLRFSARVRSGKFEFPELPAGSYLIQLRVSGREAVTQTAFLSAGGETKVQLEAGKKRARKASAEEAASRR